MFNLIGAKEIVDYINRRDVLIIDLRDKEDYEDLHVYGAVNMNYDRCININADKYKRMIVVIYCDKGNLSLKAAVKLGNKGVNVLSVAGGFEGIKAYYG